jgi:hypothetical protein
MPEGDERIHRFADAKVSDFHVGQVLVLPNSTENNNAEARLLRKPD